MALDITPNDKNSLSITNNSRSSDSLTWDTITGTWNEHDTDTWESPRMGISKNTKNDLGITNNTKN